MSALPSYVSHLNRGHTEREKSLHLVDFDRCKPLPQTFAATQFRVPHGPLRSALRLALAELRRRNGARYQPPPLLMTPLSVLVPVSVGVVPALLGVVPPLLSVGERPWLPDDPVLLPGDPLVRIGSLLPV
jgi:hypothetical protein